MRGCFITGTDTGVGKSVLAAAIVAALLARGQPVRALKPVITGLADPEDPDWPPDDRLLAELTGVAREEVSPFRFGPAVSPHLAAELAGAPLGAAAIRRCVLDGLGRGGPMVIEGVGGLLVPLADGYNAAQMAGDAGLSLLIAARPGLGTINHTLLTLDAARAFGLAVAAVVLTPWDRSSDTDRMAVSNRETIARLGAVEVAVLPRVERADPRALAAAGAGLPLDRWLA